MLRAVLNPIASSVLAFQVAIDVGVFDDQWETSRLQVYINRWLEIAAGIIHSERFFFAGSKLEITLQLILCCERGQRPATDTRINLQSFLKRTVVDTGQKHDQGQTSENERFGKRNRLINFNVGLAISWEDFVYKITNSIWPKPNQISDQSVQNVLYGS